MSASITATPLHFIQVSLKEEPGDKHQITFECHAEDHDHACEQAQSAYPSALLKDMNCVDIGDIDPNHWRASLVPGSFVFWNDPACGLSSGEYVLEKIHGENYCITNEAGSEVEALLHELAPSKPNEQMEVFYHEELLGNAAAAEQAVAIAGEYHHGVGIATHRAIATEVITAGHARTAWVVSEAPVRMQLVLDVTYIPNGVSADDLRDTLSSMVQRAIGNGLLTGDSAAEIDAYETAITTAPEPLSEKAMSDFMLRRIEDGELELADIPLRLARFGMMNPVAFQIEMQERIANHQANV